jgi:hypothetical protein
MITGDREDKKTKKKVIGLRGGDSPYQPSETTRGHSTLTTMISNDGKDAPPLSIFKGKQVAAWMHKDKVMPGARVAVSKNGWITTRILTDWIKSLVEGGWIKAGECIVADGHSTHLSVELAEYLLSKGIYLWLLPPHTTHLLQPLDVYVFGIFKSFFHKDKRKFQAEHERAIKIQDVPYLIKRAYLHSHTRANIVRSWELAGMGFEADTRRVEQLAIIKKVDMVPEMSDEDLILGTEDLTGAELIETMLTSLHKTAAVKSDRAESLLDQVNVISIHQDEFAHTCVTEEEWVEKARDKEAEKAAEEARKATGKLERAAKKKVREEEAAARAKTRKEKAAVTLKRKTEDAAAKVQRKMAKELARATKLAEAAAKKQQTAAAKKKRKATAAAAAPTGSRKKRRKTTAQTADACTNCGQGELVDVNWVGCDVCGGWRHLTEECSGLDRAPLGDYFCAHACWVAAQKK